MSQFFPLIDVASFSPPEGHVQSIVCIFRFDVVTHRRHSMANKKMKQDCDDIIYDPITPHKFCTLKKERSTLLSLSTGKIEIKEGDTRISKKERISPFKNYIECNKIIENLNRTPAAIKYEIEDTITTHTDHTNKVS